MLQFFYLSHILLYTKPIKVQQIGFHFLIQSTVGRLHFGYWQKVCSLHINYLTISLNYIQLIVFKDLPSTILRYRYDCYIVPLYHEATLPYTTILNNFLVFSTLNCTVSLYFYLLFKISHSLPFKFFLILSIGQAT